LTNYLDIRFSLSKIQLEDSWLVQFHPDAAKEIIYLKYKDYMKNFKPYGNDGMNGNGLNVKNE